MRDRTTRILDGTTYAPGGKFRVTKNGAKLSGWAPDDRALTGFRQDLEPGDIITCTGFGRGLGSDPGYGIEFTSDRAREAGAQHCEFSPGILSPYSYRPQPGWLEPVSIEDELKARLRKLSQKWVALSRHPSRRHYPEVRETFERCATELLAEITQEN